MRRSIRSSAGRPRFIKSTEFPHLFGGNFGALQACGHVAFKGQEVLNANCLARHGAGFNHAVWQPESRFWEFQGVETALFAGVGLLLIAYAAWHLLQAD